MGGKLLLFIGSWLLLSSGGYSDPIGICPEENEEYVTFLTDSNDCTIFYKCETGVPYQYQCPSPLYFNPEINVCDWPEQVECGLGTGNNGNGTEGNEVNPPPEGEGESEEDSPPPTGCPSENGEYVDFLPHESDCTLFYKCDRGVPVLKECPAGLYFNQNLNVCDWPENAGCGTVIPAPEEESAEDEVVNPPPGEGESEEDNPPPTGCPSENGEYVDFLPHESDCTLFYKCDWGVPVLKECPAGLHFNQNLNVCDWPENAGCGPVVPGPDDESDEDEVVNPPPGEGESEEDNPPPTGCPSENGEYVDFLPHESDCTLFYKCDWGVPVLKECPAGLHFNQNLNVCDWPENAGCGPVVPGPDDESDEDEVVNPPPGEGESEEDNPPPTGCPSENGEYVDFLPHESDCTLFYKCDWGIPILHQCPSGLHFNQNLNVCDWPENAGCGPVVPGPDDESDEDEVVSPPPGEGESEEDNPPPTGCPSENGEYVDFLPHESDCTLFYKCDWGVPVLKECPAGLHFNQNLNVCDWPENAGCGPVVPGPDDESDEDEVVSPPPGEGESEEDNPPPTGCPSENGEYVDFLPHESDCTLFYKCDWGIPILHQCPSGLHFNQNLNVCDWPENAGCGPVVPGPDDESDEDEVVNPPPGEGESEEDNPPPTGCPSENGEYVDFLPHESDCTLFYKCDWGVPVLKECPAGLHFNQNLNVCDWPENAGCGPVVPGPDGESDEDEVVNPPPGEGESEEDSPPPTGCPSENGEYVDFLPHESDCTLFYKCDWGVPVLKECPAGLHFNQNLNVCDWPENAGCGPVVPGPDGESDEDEVVNPPPGEGESEEDSPPPTGCPSENGEYVDFLPHESDCTLFYKCDWGVPVLKECPAGLHFNQNLNVCDWPENAGCGPVVPGPDGESDEDEVVNPPPGEGESEEDSPPPTGCPSENGEYVDFLPHESDCTLFYKCDWGVPVLKECPAGLHFNQNLNVCDWPENAGCGPVVPGPDGESDEDEVVNPPPGEGESEEDSPPPTGCPSENGEYVDFLPHESDCTLFYKCDWGVPVLKECPAGLHFNQNLNVCDWPENAGCGPVVPGPDGESDEDEVVNPPPGEGESEEDSPPPTGCPSENGEYVDFLPHESDCTLFYKCDWGVPVLKECPAGLHFNQNLNVCDWPENAGCGPVVPGPDDESDEDEVVNPPPGENDSEEDNPPPTGCPSENGEYVDFLPHESDCTLFYKCDWGVPVLKECPAGLHFNQNLNVCDWPENAGCGPVVPGPDEESDEDEVVNPPPGENDSEEDNPPPTGCPSENGEYVDFLPHESDCTLFYKCDWGIPILHQCPAGLHFNQNLNVCDWPENAGCGPVVPGPDEESDEDEVVNPPPGENGSEEDNPPPTGCPSENGEYVDFLPHESDCTLFYKCDWGVPVLKECPAGLHFNQNLNVCDWPENAGCGPVVPGPDEESDENDVSIPPPEGGESSEGGGGNGGDGFCQTISCPAENEAYVTFIPFEGDCTRFCKCDWGIAFEFTCPAGLYFNPIKNVCDWPEDSGCTI